MDRGWIKLWRKTLDSAVWADEHLFRAWTWCILSANHIDRWVKVHGMADPVLVKRGQLLTGRYALNKALYPKQRKTDPSPSTTWRWFQTLEKLGNLHIQTNSRFSIVTVCTFGCYNDAADDSEQPNDAPVNSRRTAGEQPVNTNKNEENEENEKNRRKKRAPQSNADQDLADLCDWWNGLHRDKLVSVSVRTGNPNEGVKASWRRVKRSTDLRTLLLENRESLRNEIRQSSFCRKPWFRLEKLFGGKNPDGELIVQKLLEGGYRDDSDSSSSCGGRIR